MKRPHGLTITAGNGIIAALRLRTALSTDSLCEWAGRSIGANEEVYTSQEWKGLIYRTAVKMENKSQTLTSSKVYNGKGYERVWRLK